MLKRVSQCIPAIYKCTLLWSIQPLSLLSLPLLYPSPMFQQLSIHILIFSTFTNVKCYDIVDALHSLSFPSFPKFHCAVPLLQTCSTYRFVYGHVYFCVYVYVFQVYLLHLREIMQPLSF
jgi:hypothetical protein